MPRPSLALALLAAPLLALSTAQEDAAAPELYTVTRIVDGDTVRVLYRGEDESLRLLSVDTEETIKPGTQSSPTKPQTAYGDETAEWTRALFAERAAVDGELQVELRFPGGVEARDVWGRLLCHVVFPDGTDFNLLLVREGKSPYFDKYGRSEIDHAGFVAAEAEARAALRGVWDPSCNKPDDADAPWVRRPYERLLPWWEARAEAIARFRADRERDPDAVLDAESPAELALAAASTDEVEVFGELYRVYDEDNGWRTLLFRATDRERPLRVRIPPERLEAFAPLRLRSRTDDFAQNYLRVRGELRAEGPSFAITVRDPAQVRAAGPEVAASEAAPPEPAGVGG